MADSVIVSRFFLKPVSFEWKIENYSEFPLTVEPSLTVSCDNEFYVLTANRSKGVCITLEYKHKESSAELRYFMALVNNDGNRQFKQRGSIKDPHCTSMIYNVLPDDFQKEKENLLYDDCLKIYGELKHVSLSEDQCDKSVADSISYYRPDELAIDLGELFENKQNADVVFHVEEQEIAAHMIILSARSSVFAAMFEQDMAEKQSKVVNITGVRSSVMHHLLHYIYTGKAEDTAEKIADFPVELLSQLYTAADKYAILSLKEMCSQIMRAKLSADNLEDFAELAYRHSDAAFQAAVTEFISENESVLDPGKWQQLTSKVPQLAPQVLQFAFKKCKI